MTVKIRTSPPKRGAFKVFPVRVFHNVGCKKRNQFFSRNAHTIGTLQQGICRKYFFGPNDLPIVCVTSPLRANWSQKHRPEKKPVGPRFHSLIHPNPRRWALSHISKCLANVSNATHLRQTLTRKQKVGPEKWANLAMNMQFRPWTAFLPSLL